MTEPASTAHAESADSLGNGDPRPSEFSPSSDEASNCSIFRARLASETLDIAPKTVSSSDLGKTSLRALYCPVEASDKGEIAFDDPIPHLDLVCTSTKGETTPHRTGLGSPSMGRQTRSSC